MKLVLATTNPGKVREFAALLERLRGVSLHDLSAFPPVSVDEDGATLEENALKKARERARVFECAVIADDSGLEVDCLGGEPGVHSARYAGPHASDAENNALLLERIRSVDDEKPRARFRSVVAFVDPAAPDGALEHVESGILEGYLVREPRGEQGFGYDPLFVPWGGDRTLAELSMSEKNRFSHRGTATRAMAAFLERYLSP